MRSRALMTVLAVALAAALAAPAAAGGGSHDYTFGWKESADTLLTTQGETREGRSVDVPVDASVTNLTALRFLLHWGSEDAPEATVSLAILDPDGHERALVEDTSRKGVVDAVVRVQETPPGEVTVRAGSDDDAWAEFHERYPPSDVGAGSWTARITVEDVDNDGGFLPLPGRPNATSWELHVDAGIYAGILKDRKPVDDDAPPQQSPEEMPPPGDDEWGDEDREDHDRGAAANLFATPGAESALVLAAAVIGIAAALALARRKA